MKKPEPRRSRRKVLKSLAIGGGTVVAIQAAPARWTRPLVEHVVLPAHAQTSGPDGGPSADGTFTTGIVQTRLDDPVQRRLALEMLDAFFPAAHALSGDPNNRRDGIRKSVCGEHGDGGGSFSVAFRINGNDVDICFSSLGGFQECTKAVVSRLNGNQIESVAFIIDDELDSGRSYQEEVSLSALQLNDGRTRIKGDFTIVSAGGDEWPACSQSFTANITSGPFKCDEGCG